MIYLLMAVLLALLFITYECNEKDVLCPSFLFTLSFVFSCVWACMFAGKWDLGLHLNTFLVISIGVFEFIAVGILIHQIYSHVNKYPGNGQYKAFLKIKIPVWVEILYLLFVVYLCIWKIKEMVAWAGLSFSQFTQAGRMIDNLKFQSFDKFAFSKNLAFLSLFLTAGAYWFGYMMMDELVNLKKLDIFKAMIVLLSIWNATLTGSRSSAMYILAGLFYFWLYFLQKKKNSNQFLSRRMLFIIIGAAIVILGSFRSIGLLMHRTINQNTLEYLALYAGAEIKNLDLFLQEPRPYSSIWGSQTFIYLVRSFGGRLGIENSYYALDLPFRSINGFNLGNVYTVFYPFIYDFGYIGLILLTALMSFVTQMAYEISRNSRNSDISLIFTVIYGTMISTLLLSFFSNKFYENIFTVEYVKRTLVLIFMHYIFARLLSCRRDGSGKLKDLIR